MNFILQFFFCFLLQIEIAFNLFWFPNLEYAEKIWIWYQKQLIYLYWGRLEVHKIKSYIFTKKHGMNLELHRSKRQNETWKKSERNMIEIRTKHEFFADSWKKNRIFFAKLREKRFFSRNGAKKVNRIKNYFSFLKFKYFLSSETKKFKWAKRHGPKNTPTLSKCGERINLIHINYKMNALKKCKTAPVLNSTLNSEQYNKFAKFHFNRFLVDQ